MREDKMRLPWRQTHHELDSACPQVMPALTSLCLEVWMRKPKFLGLWQAIEMETLLLAEVQLSQQF